MTSHESPLLATVRAGNVIGGGDWGEDRLVPDLVRAQSKGALLAVRSPDATRPWQHVLDCLAGYLLLGANLLAGKRDCACAWNLGPDPKNTRTVADVLTGIEVHWPGLQWRVDHSHGPHESRLLSLDSTRARSLLGWRTVWSLDEALAATATWHRRYLAGQEVSSREQLAQFLAAARGVKQRPAIA
jgi:CDP-glucose 4,6-dehydratase